MIPPSAFSKTTAISTVGVDEREALTTSIPQAINVPQTRFSTISPEILASLPTTTLYRLLPGSLILSLYEYAETNFTISGGVSAVPGSPPIVPLIPEMDLISVILRNFCSHQR